MWKNFLYTLFISASFFLIAGCSFDEVLDGVDQILNEESDFAQQIESISELKNTDYFKQGALAHILEGELNKKNQAVGFHYDRLPTKKGEIIPGTATEPNDFGVFEAEVKVNDVAKTSNKGRSSFFPNEWTTQQVVDAINEAYEHRAFISGNTYEGLTAEGMPIRMYLDNKDLIISAFPVY